MADPGWGEGGGMGYESPTFLIIPAQVFFYVSIHVTTQYEVFKICFTGNISKLISAIVFPKAKFLPPLPSGSALNSQSCMFFIDKLKFRVQ